MTLRIRWIAGDGGKQEWLFAGDLDEPLATITKCTKRCESWIWLPGVTARKQYAPYDDAKRVTEMQVREWFEAATRPA